MASRRHRIDPDARSDGESWISKPFEPLRQRRWIDSVPASLGRKGHVCFVIAPSRSIQILLRRDASHTRPLRPIVRPLVFRQSLVLGRGYQAILYELQTFKRLKTYLNPNAFTQAMCFVPDSTNLIVAGGGFEEKGGEEWMRPWDDTILIFDLPKPLP